MQAQPGKLFDDFTKDHVHNIAESIPSDESIFREGGTNQLQLFDFPLRQVYRNLADHKEILRSRVDRSTRQAALDLLREAIWPTPRVTEQVDALSDGSASAGDVDDEDDDDSSMDQGLSIPAPRYEPPSRKQREREEEEERRRRDEEENDMGQSISM